MLSTVVLTTSNQQTIIKKTLLPPSNYTITSKKIAITASGKKKGNDRVRLIGFSAKPKEKSCLKARKMTKK
jgi:hypothetical protein